MFKKHYLPIIKVLLLVISIIVLFEIEWNRIYAACRDHLSARDIYGTSEIVFTYQYTEFFPPPVTLVFDDGSGEVSCAVHRQGLKWVVNTITDVSRQR